MTTLLFDTTQDPADFTPDFLIPTGFQAGDVGVYGFSGNGNGINSGWISSTVSGAGLYAETTFGSGGNTTDSRGPIFVNSNGDGYLLLTRGSNTRLFLIQSGTLSELDPVAVGHAAGDVARLEYLGAGQFVYYKNGTEIGSFTDTTVTAGLAPGFVCRDVGATMSEYADGAVAVTSDYTARKGSTFTVNHSLANAPDSATLNGVSITIDSADATTATVIDSSGVTTSGVYTLELTDSISATSETSTVQVNVVGLSSFNLNENNVTLGSLTDVEFIAMTGAAGSRAITEQVSAITTDASGETGAVEFTDLSLDVGDPVLLAQHSATAVGGATFEAILEAI